MPERGSVKRIFHRADGSWYGFLDIKAGPDLYFDIGGHRGVKIRDNRPGFFSNWDEEIPLPPRGAVVVFEWGSNEVGTIAAEWTLESEWNEVAKGITQDKNEDNAPAQRRAVPLPNLTPGAVCRVLEQRQEVGDPPGVPRTIWEGSDLDELNRLHPRPVKQKEDLLRPRVPTDGSGRVWLIHDWQELLPNGYWRPCQDPRRPQIHKPTPAEDQEAGIRNPIHSSAASRPERWQRPLDRRQPSGTRR